MSKAKQPESLRLADRLQNAVATYPQVSEDEPGGYRQEVDQVMDEAAAELRRQHARIAELEAQLEAVGAGGVQALSAAPVTVSDTKHSQFLSDVLTAAGLITHGKQCKALGERLSDMVMRLRADQRRYVYAAPQPAPVAQGDALTYEQHGAIRQWHEIEASDSYFDARPQIDNNDRRKVFEAGFERGWDAARSQAKEGA